MPGSQSHIYVRTKKTNLHQGNSKWVIIQGTSKWVIIGALGIAMGLRRSTLNQNRAINDGTLRSISALLKPVY